MLIKTEIFDRIPTKVIATTQKQEEKTRRYSVSLHSPLHKSSPLLTHSDQKWKLFQCRASCVLTQMLELFACKVIICVSECMRLCNYTHEIPTTVFAYIRVVVCFEMQ